MENDKPARPDNYFENIKNDRRFENSTSPIHDGTRNNWKPYGNYRENTVEEIARKSKRL